MAQKTISLKNGLGEAVAAAADVMRAGGVVIFPTETVYGVGVISGNADALARLRDLKHRDEAKPFQFLVADVAMAKRMGANFPHGAANLARNYWPGPLTLVVPDGAGATLGVRVPDSPFILALCRELGRAVVSSSANPAGAAPPLAAAAADAFGDGADLLVDGGDIVGGAPSTVVRCETERYEILRVGGIGVDAIESAWNE